MADKNGLQSMLTGALLLLVGMALGAIFVKVGQTRKAPAAKAEGVSTTPLAEKVAPSAQEAVLVYLCHGNSRCPTCLKIEASAKEVLERMFAEEIRSGRLIVKEVNYEQPENKDLILKYEIIAPTVVMVQLKDGKEAAYRNVMEVWQTVHEPAAFESLISENLKELLPKAAS
ncbi:MAG: hypothetical protein GYA33_03380 [Thermogutta sp.]|nr:hypothetical protein [Thermogutta sp.]